MAAIAIGQRSALPVALTIIRIRKKTNEKTVSE